ncbi:MAG: glycosyltransferase family 2 protein [Rhizobiaceae bacterium]|nr:glycosyltransferase family 2 protein [Rhizobiaceae bacterium]
MTSPELTIVLPSYNEARNIPVMVERLAAALPDTPHEIIVVDDDSPDRTYDVARAIGAEQPHVRCIRRVGRRGLSGACVEGMMAAAAPVVVVMDADGQHDETILPQMLEKIAEGADVVIGSRYVDGGTSGDGLTRTRARGSELATTLSQMLISHKVSDPMSGFFMLRRDLADEMAGRLSKEGFKILFDLVSRLPASMKIAEVPFTFRKREHGESKLGVVVTMQFLGLLLSRLSGGILPIQFLMFALVGASGLLVHLGALYLLTQAGVSFVWGQVLATLTAMATNFLLNNWLTFSYKRLKGLGLVWGFITFALVCSLGGIANVSVAVWVYQFDQATMLAGLAGALMSSVFNYAVTKLVTWRDA